MSFGRRTNKFGNRKTMYRKCLYDSKKEAEFAMELDSLLLKERIRFWQRQVPIELIVKDSLICRAIVDFRVIHTDGSVEYFEVKGYATAVGKLKRKLIEALYPEIRYTVR